MFTGYFGYYKKDRSRLNMATVVEMTIEKIDEVKSRLGRYVSFLAKFVGVLINELLPFAWW